MSGQTITEVRGGNVYADDAPEETAKVIYFAGGCFWGTERVFRILKGVIDTKAGYANGHTQDPVYADVCRGDTGYAETVKVTYDPAVIRLEKLLQAFFTVIHPEQEDGQGNDRGSQYRTGIYYSDPADLPLILTYTYKERKKHSAFHTEILPLEVFCEAEEYHQRYLEKNPGGYCHITAHDLDKVRKLNEH
ncbi:MAG: peptide-methionine (S)-S-oxide reductase MsrA [Solobacterium sp.]|nr:peptide-methionine (S)-S-oxide reductase MsrA [Solobacterium sp.]